MKRSKFSEEQIALTLHQAKTEIRGEEVCRQMGISEDPLCLNIDFASTGKSDYEICENPEG